jgi:hypothetical protein
MKNPYLERLGRRMRDYHRHHPWRLTDGLFIPHAYPDELATELSWWDDVGFILNRRRVIVHWIHPRMAYRDAIEEQAMAEVPDPRDPDGGLDFDKEEKHWRRLGRSRKKLVVTRANFSDEQRAYFDAVNKREQELVRAGIDLIVSPSMRVKRYWWATAIDLVAPIEVRSEKAARELAALAKRLLKRETTVAAEWPDYRYGRDTWLSECGPSLIDEPVSLLLK